MNFNQFMPQSSLKAPDFKEVDVNIKLHKLIYIYMYVYGTRRKHCFGSYGTVESFSSSSSSSSFSALQSNAI